MKSILITMLCAAFVTSCPALAQVPLKDQPISEAQRKALADHAEKRAQAKSDRELCNDIAVKSPVPDPVKIVEWHKTVRAECMKAKGYK